MRVHKAAVVLCFSFVLLVGFAYVTINFGGEGDTARGGIDIGAPQGTVEVLQEQIGDRKKNTVDPASNERDFERPSAPSPIIGTAATLTIPPSFGKTVYRKTNCGAVVTNLCLKHGQPRYFTDDPHLSLFTRSGATTLCNEAVKKPKLHMVMHEVTTKPPYPMRVGRRGRGVGTSSSSSLLLVPFCWELYGYHLLLCLLSVWTNLCRLEGLCIGVEPGDIVTLGYDEKRVLFNTRATTVTPQPTITVGYLKGSGLFPYLRGSSSSWENTTAPQNTPSKAQSTTYWPLWRIFTDDPSAVSPLPDIEPACFSRGVLGHIPSYDVTPVEQQLFRLALLRRLRVFDQEVSSSKSIVIGRIDATRAMCSATSSARDPRVCISAAVVQRARRYKITNLNEVVAALKQGLESGGEGGRRYTQWCAEVAVYYLEEMPVVEQVRLMANVDVLVGVHGNGLSWSMLMQSTAALIELWPRGPYNSNYQHFCWRGNLYYTSVNGDGTCPSRCSANYAPDAVERAAKDVATHLARVRCEKMKFNSTTNFFEAKAKSEQRKREKALRG